MWDVSAIFVEEKYAGVCTRIFPPYVCVRATSTLISTLGLKAFAKHIPGANTKYTLANKHLYNVHIRLDILLLEFDDRKSSGKSGYIRTHCVRTSRRTRRTSAE